ncbi:dihydropteroate synthase [Halobium salinum]|uniref:Probable bifunctional folylpolyglutamate synthase/dihydropteroate synthase n=1 Tax=Halobium salinum TaxID=1364940 RepID=A0ABD5PIL1_9EURY|nr:dihydropteroate synthase [Halobium salinum]
MEYHESADALLSLQRRRPKLGTETTARMLAHLGDPHAGFDCVQVAGSNGKGSTARMLESVLRAAGLDVGLFTSPKLRDLREQIRVNGRMIPKSRLAAAVERLDPCLERLRENDDAPTHFEALTALALSHFGEADVDVAVLEVGIGGRYDATSAVDPVASAVTSVSLEHTDLLGDTVEEIARDKAQVAPADAPLVTGADGAALDAIRSETEVVTVGSGEVGSGEADGTGTPDAPTDADAAPDVVAVEHGLRSGVESAVSLDGPGWSVETRLSLLGPHQATNAGVAATLAGQVADVDERTLARGLRDATWPGRFEVVDADPTVVLDGSHNPGAAETVATLLDRYEYDDLHVVFAAMADKDYEGMVEALPPVDTAYPTRPDVERAEEPDALAAAFEGHAERVRRVDSVPEATERALAAADEGDFVLVTGSLHAVAEARDRWTRLVVPKDGGRGGTRRGADADAVLADAAFPDGSADAVERETVATTLRTAQAEAVADRLDALGGHPLRSSAGTPEGVEATVLSGTRAQLRELADSVAADGSGLAGFGRRLDAALDGPTPPPAFDVDGTAVVGVLNVTPDSFHDGGEYDTTEAAVERAEAMLDAGADVIDVGGESTRPGADPVPAETEMERVLPVVEALAGRGVTVSIDTRKAVVAEAALDAGATVVNDVSGLADPEMRFVVAEHDATLVLMHSLSAPVDPDRTATYDDVVTDVLHDLAETVLHAERAGVDRERIVVDPGVGFGKDAAESFELVDRIGELRALGCSVLLGHSRKSMFERVGCASGERLPPTLAVTAMAADRGVDAVRVHDAGENAAVVRTVAAATRR